MGGSGGFFGYGGIKIHMPIDSCVADAQSSQVEIEINEFLEELLKNINDRDVEAINKHLSEIEKVLGREIEGFDKILFGGSISKNTFIEGASDVDALVILNSDTYSDKNPKELQNVFFDLLKKRFPKTEIKKGNLAVTLKFSDYEVQLLPALRENGKIKISDANKNKWSNAIDIKQFTDRLTNVNKMNNNKVVPVIKLAKKVLSNMPEQYKLSGYHIEAMAVEIFSTYNGRNTLYDMLKYYLDSSIKRVLRPMRDITGQSHNIDDDLGVTKSILRQQISSCIKDISSHFSGVDAVSATKNLFGD